MAIQIAGSGGDDDVMLELNTTPLIDILLVLLVMLIISLPVRTNAVRLDMPSVDAIATGNPAIIDLEIDFDGTVLWNGNAVYRRETLNWYFESIGRRDVQPHIHLRPNRLARYDSVARTLADAQRLGVKNIAFVGTEQYRD